MQIGKIRYNKRDSAGTAQGHKQECIRMNKNEKNEENKNTDKEKVIKKKAAFIPDDYKLTQEHIRIALQNGYPENKITSEFEYFHDYWMNRSDKKAKKVNWLKTWELWIKRDVNKIKPEQKTKQQTLDEKNAEVMKKWLEKKQLEENNGKQ